MIAAIIGLALAATPINGPHARAALGAVEERFYSAAYHACSAKAQSTLAMTDCRAAEAGRWDKRLNAAYQADLKSFTAEDRAALQKAQRAWVAFRDANCAAYEDPTQWGSISRVNAADCLLSMTATRALELEDFPPSPCGETTC